MSKNNKKHAADNNADNVNAIEENAKNKTRTRFFTAIIVLIVSGVSLGMSFVPNYGIYFLISSVLLEISALSFLASQKKIYYFRAVKIAQIFGYVLLFLSIALFSGGFVYFLLNSRQV